MIAIFRAYHIFLNIVTQNTFSGGKKMLQWAFIFLVVALVAGLLGFTGIAGTAAGIAKILFVVFLVVFIIMFVMGRKPRI